MKMPRLAQLLAVLASTEGAAAQTPVPLGPDQRLNQNGSFSQYWVRAARDPVGDALAFSVSSGQEVVARFFDDFAPITGDIQCNTLHTVGIQDEAEIGWSVDGHYLVAWSERSGADGEQMGIFGRIFDSVEVP